MTGMDGGNDQLMGEAEELRKEGRAGEAIRVYLKVIEADPHNVNAHMRVAGLYYTRRSDDEAMKHYLKAAALFVDKGMFSHAAMIIRMASHVKQLPLEALKDLVDIYVKLGETEKASSTLYLLVRRLGQAGRFDKALDAKKRLYQLQEDSEEITPGFDRFKLGS
jgi:tetratricopeptide (TPR) repeat protein